MNLLLLSITLLCGLLIIYHHVGYPVILKIIKKYSNNRSQKYPIKRQYDQSSNDQSLPSFTIIIPAFNEQQWISEKIFNLSALDYPAEKLEIIISCDGCTDETANIARQTSLQPECNHLNLNIIDNKENQGKVSIINSVIKLAKGELIALSDVSSIVSVDALLYAVEHFKDPSIGVLNGHYRLLNPGTPGEIAYWNYQSNIKSCEASLGSTLGAHGAFYMFRKSLFNPLATDTINDDFILPMNIVAKGYRAEYEKSITALELESASDKQDHLRRRRISAGNIQQILRLKKLFLPKYKGIAFAFISGKGLRVLMPFLMIITFIGSLLLAFENNLFVFIFLTQALAYLIAGWQLIFNPKASNNIFKLLGYIVNGHLATLFGAFRYLFKLDKGHWKKLSTEDFKNE